MEETGARISVPPLSLQKDEIVVSGEKEGVHKAVETINNIYEDKVRLKYSEIDQDDLKWFLARFFFFEKRNLELLWSLSRRRRRRRQRPNPG